MSESTTASQQITYKGKNERIFLSYGFTFSGQVTLNCIVDALTCTSERFFDSCSLVVRLLCNLVYHEN